jgi:hypothetical protein
MMLSTPSDLGNNESTLPGSVVPSSTARVGRNSQTHFSCIGCGTAASPPQVPNRRESLKSGILAAPILSPGGTGKLMAPEQQQKSGVRSRPKRFFNDAGPVTVSKQPKSVQLVSELIKTAGIVRQLRQVAPVAQEPTTVT